MKHQEGLGNSRRGRETSLRWEGRLFRESRLGRETRLGRDTRLGRETSLCFEGRLCRKSRRDRDSKLNRDISLGWEGAPPWRAGWAGRAAEQGDQPLVGGGRLCRESWLGIAYSNRCIYHFNPTSPPLNLNDAS